VRLDYSNGLNGFMFGDIMTIYFPHNYTSNIQPFDQGLIRAVKQRYRNSLLDWTLNEMKHYDGSIDFGNHVPYSYESLHRLRRSSVDVPNSMFVNCFRRTRILPHDAPYQEDISSGRESNAEGADCNPQSNIEECLASINKVCEKTTPAEKVEEVQERLSQLII
jgi:hypothetical protein